jgi:hypothetical protein
VFQSFQEAPTLSEGNMVPRAYYVAWGDNHRSWEAESCTGMADPK